LPQICFGLLLKDLCSEGGDFTNHGKLGSRDGDVASMWWFNQQTLRFNPQKLGLMQQRMGNIMKIYCS
jgi:hypothetical protein